MEGEGGLPAGADYDYNAPYNEIDFILEEDYMDPYDEYRDNIREYEYPDIDDIYTVN